METMLICTTSGFFSVGTENSQCTSATHGPRRGSRIVRIPRRPALDQRDRDPGQGFHRRQCAGGLDRSGSTGAGTVGACAAPAGLAFKRRKGRRIGTSVRGDPALRTGDDGSVTGEGICPSAAAARSLLRFDLTRTAVLLGVLTTGRQGHGTGTGGCPVGLARWSTWCMVVGLAASSSSVSVCPICLAALVYISAFEDPLLDSPAINGGPTRLLVVLPAA
jgi:hypothetical protein